MEKLLILNPGSTSTKIAVFDGETPVFQKNIEHNRSETAGYKTVAEQYEFRLDIVLGALNEAGIELSELTAIVSRGGMLPPLSAGAYEVNEDMVWQLRNAPVNEHASSLGAMIAFEIARRENIRAYIYDAVSVDELEPVMRVAGHPRFSRKSFGHYLNMRAAAMRYAKEANRRYEDCVLIIAHLGGGISVSLHSEGKTIDICTDETGPFSSERTGGLPSPQLVELAFSGEFEKDELLSILKSKGGLLAHLGTNDLREVEKMMEEGDGHAGLIYSAMALNIAKFIAGEAAAARGKVDAILLTGGMAYSKNLTDMISERVEFISPVIVYPGENEMESLALGGLRTLRGLEEAKLFTRV